MDKSTQFYVFLAVVGGVAWYALKPKTAAAGPGASGLTGNGLNTVSNGSSATATDPLGLGALSLGGLADTAPPAGASSDPLGLGSLSASNIYTSSDDSSTGSAAGN